MRLRLLLDVEVGQIARVGGVHHEGDAAHVARAEVDVDPGRDVGAGQHLAHPEDFALALDVLGRDAVGDAPARAAGHEAEHQARIVRHAAAEHQAHAEAAAEAVDVAGQALVDVDRRIPHQRAVAEDPKILAGARAAAMIFGARLFPRFLGERTAHRRIARRAGA